MSTCSVNTREFHALLTAATRATGASVMPILAMTHIAWRDDTITLTGTDLVGAMRVTGRGTTDGDATICVDGRLLAPWVASVNGERITLEAGDASVKASSGRYRIELPTLSPADYPIVPTYEESEHLCDVSASDLSRLITSVAYAAARDESRPVLAGVQLVVTPEEITAGAADGFRMAFARCDATPAVSEPMSFIVPRKVALMLGKTAHDEGAEMVQLARSGEGRIIARIGDVQVGCALIDGTYPDIQAIMNPLRTSDGARVIVAVSDLIGAVKAGIQLSAQNNDIVFLASTEDAMDVQSRADASEAVTTIDAEVDGGLSAQVAMNATYLLDMLATMGGDVEVWIAGANTAVNVVPHAHEVGRSVRHIVMPMVLGG